MEDKYIKRMKNIKIQFLVFFVLLFVTDTILFFSAWIVGINNSNRIYFEVLSYFLAHNQESRIIYLSWFILYIIMNSYMFYLMLINDISIIENQRHEVHSEVVHCSFHVKEKAYVLSTIFFVPFTVLKLYGFFLLWIYNLDKYGTDHYIWTAIAMISSIVCSVLLFIRRLSSRVYPYLTSMTVFIFIVNFIFIVCQIVFISLLPGAVDSFRGICELLLAIFIGIDPIFFISDLYHDIICPSTVATHVNLNNTDYHIDRKYGRPKIKENNIIQNIEILTIQT